MQLPLGNGYYVSTSPTISNQLCNNWYPNYPQSPALSDQSLIPTPGIEALITAADATDSDRGGIVFQDKPWFVIGTTLVRIDENIVNDVKTYIELTAGTVAGTSRVSIAKNNTQICIVVPGSNTYIYSTSTGLIEITEINTPGFTAGANVVVYLNGYFIFATDTELFVSALNDGTTYNALDRAGAEVDPDDIVTLHVYNNQLYVLGVDVTEVFQDVANPVGFPLQRVEGFIIDKGCVGIFAVTEFEDSFIFVGSGFNEQPAMWRVRSSTPEKISSTPIDTVIGKLSANELSTTVALSYAQEGAFFAVFSFIDNVFVYDSTASAIAQRPIWHTRTSIVNLSLKKWRVSTILEAFGRLIVADNITNDIGALELDFFQEYGETIKKTWTSITIAKENMDPLFCRQLRMQVEAGLSNDEDNKLSMSISDNGGKTYQNPIPRDMGALGQYETRLVWDRLGRHPRYFTFKLEHSANSRCVIARLDTDIL